ncbi:hypothetical protein ACWDA3_51375 [Nonomuraea rubra]
MADAVLAVLSGTPTDVAAAAINTRPETLADAIETYQTAGYQALETGAADHDWYSIRIQFPDWESAEQAAMNHLGPRLDRLQDLISVTWTGSCAFAGPWAASFRDAGKSLGEAAAAGYLDRGIRHVLTHLVIFHWNRLGLPATTQALLSHAARAALLPTENLREEEP